jgi:hypothetical protein
MDGTGDEPALLAAPTEAVRAELRAALTEALGRAPAALAEDALMRSSQLIIERAALAGAANPALTGRTLGLGAERFVLVRNRGQCLLVRPEDTWRRVLASADCIPE